MSSARNHKMRSRYSYQRIPFAMFARNAQKRAIQKAQRNIGLALSNQVEEPIEAEIVEE